MRQPWRRRLLNMTFSGRMPLVSGGKFRAISWGFFSAEGTQHHWGNGVSSLSLLSGCLVCFERMPEELKSINSNQAFLSNLCPSSCLRTGLVDLFSGFGR